MSERQHLILKISSVLWFMLGAVVALICCVSIISHYAPTIEMLFGVINAQEVIQSYTKILVKIDIFQAWNLTWASAVAMIGATFIWHKNITAIWVTAMVFGLTSIGLLLFVDPSMAQYYQFVLIIGLVAFSAAFLSFWVWLSIIGVIGEPELELSN